MMPETVPETMTAIEISTPGGPEALVPATRPVPSPGPGEVLIRVAAAGINRPDIMQRQGKYPPPPGAPDIPGLEVAGTVVTRGAGVESPALGATICALLAGGGYAEYCVAPAPQCLPVPAGLSMIAAAALPETFFTVWTNAYDRGHLAPGETMLVHGGSSGIGTTAIQIATALGSRVVVTAGNAEKCATCLELGAVAAINYREEDFVARVRDVTDGKGVDIILDMVGADYFARNLEALADEGRLVQIALQTGAKTELNLLSVMLRRLILTGSTLRPRSVAEKGAIARTLADRVWPLIAEGRIKPVIFETFPLARAADAHRLMESSRHIGKIVLAVDAA